MVDIDSVVQAARYPKRKRVEVSYVTPDDSQDEWQSEQEYNSQPKRRRKIGFGKLPKHKIFPFMNLPPELRNKIYSHALSDARGIFITSRTKGYRRVAQRCTELQCQPEYGYRRYGNQNAEESGEAEYRSFVPNLLAVCQAVHAEAGTFLYSQSITVADNYALLAWLTQIGPQHIKMVRNITIEQWCGGRAHKSMNFPALAMLAPATELRRLNIACELGIYRSYWRQGKTQKMEHRIARKVFRDCWSFLEAYGRAKGDIIAGVDVIEVSERNFEHRGDELNVELKSFRDELCRLLRT